MERLKDSFVELSARERAKAIFDQGTFREFLGPFDQLESPHLVAQGIVPQSDDGVIVARGTIDQEPAVVISIEGNFQGGGIGEISGAKIAGALELALADHEKGVPTRPVLLLDTGGIRLQEANYGLLAIAEIGAAIVALRKYIPVVGVIPGKIGSFGGMSINAGLLSTLIMTREGRLGLNGPEVIEQEAGIEEFDSFDRRMIWSTIGGAQRMATGFIDELVEDDISTISKAVREAFNKELLDVPRSSKVQLYRSLMQTVDPSRRIDPLELGKLWKQISDDKNRTNQDDKDTDIKIVHDHHIRNVHNDDIKLVHLERSSSLFQEIDPAVTSRGRTWFNVLTGNTNSVFGDVPSVLCKDITLGKERLRFIAVVPNPANRFPRVRQGELGLEEGWAIAKYVHEAIIEDQGREKRAIVAIVDVPSQAYGYHEELLGIHQACAAAVEAYASARLAGHPVISLIVGKAISGAFLAHGLQANRILALNDQRVNVQVMSKRSAARITRRTIEQLEEAAQKIPAIAYDIGSFMKLGAVHELIEGVHADEPGIKDQELIREKLIEVIQQVRSSSNDLNMRLTSRQAIHGRALSIKVRERLANQWNSCLMM